MGLVREPGKVEGEIQFEGQNLLELSKKAMRKLRGNEISMIFQEPMSSLNPVFKIGNQIREVIVQHRKVSKAEAHKLAIEMLERVGIPDAAKVAGNYPHQLSGGMRQRVMIAMALACRPKLLIADEPTTALDVTIQAQILKLIAELSEQENTGIILITHDLGVVAEMADRVAVMYAGEVVEEASVFDLFEKPGHPYTLGLLGSLPRLTEQRDRLDSIPGTVPNMLNMPEGCPFHPRCPYAEERCKRERPELRLKESDHRVRCLRMEEIPD
ncbi:Oligopeptide transport ATP-binding protein OppD [compost metagenome]